MTTKIERTCLEFQRMIETQYPHVKRACLAVPTLLLRIDALTTDWGKRTHRQVWFHYRNVRFKVRFSHEGGGQFEVVRQNGQADGPIALIVRKLQDADTLDLQGTLDAFLDQKEAA